MKKTKEKIWETFHEVCRDLKEEDTRVRFHEEQKEAFFDGFQKLYNMILNNCMALEKGITTLDRHKVAAIITVSGIESDFITMDEVPAGKIFLGKEVVSLSVALSFMQAALNYQLKEACVDKKVEQFIFPKALACDTDYFDIMVRNLYYSQKYWKMNPLELAEKFFLIENITLDKNGIDSDLLREQSYMDKQDS